jgi:hypothetical protein
VGFPRAGWHDWRFDLRITLQRKRKFLALSHLRAQDSFGTNAEIAASKYCKYRQGAALHGTPTMEIVLTNDKNVRQAIRTAIGNVLRSYYSSLLKEPMPSRLIALLRRLDELDKAYSEKQE